MDKKTLSADALALLIINQEDSRTLMERATNKAAFIQRLLDVCRLAQGDSRDVVMVSFDTTHGTTEFDTAVEALKLLGWKYVVSPRDDLWTEKYRATTPDYHDITISLPVG